MGKSGEFYHHTLRDESLCSIKSIPLLDSQIYCQYLYEVEIAMVIDQDQVHCVCEAESMLRVMVRIVSVTPGKNDGVLKTCSL
jgi:hypothetical protein